jgi:hypothetical protein
VKALEDRVRNNSTLLREAEQADEFTIVGAYYDIKAATVRLR